jgi:pimeloyl-ACP methyl ester carboxylesterase
MTRTIQHVTTPSGELAYEERGHGAVALFVHGVFVNGHLWRHVVDQVSDVRRCISIDLLAHGETRIDPGQDVSFRAQAQMLEEFCEALGLDQVDLVANDSGGGIAQIFAARHPERIRSLTLTNCDVHDNWPPPALGPTRELIAAGGFADLAAQMLTDVEVARAAFSVAYEDPTIVDEELVRTYIGPLAATPQRAADLARFFAHMDGADPCDQTVEIEPLLRQLDAPTLVVWGTGDIFFDVKWAHWLHDTIPGCERVVELEGAKLFFPEERPDDLVPHLLGLWSDVPAVG